MDIDFKSTEVEDANEVLDEVVESSNELKTMLVNYVGEKQTPGNESVTVEMIVDQLANEFPEFVLAVAEENFVRGYQQALTDVEVGRQAWEEEQQNNEQE
jgi:deoxyhypusine synthase